MDYKKLPADLRDKMKQLERAIRTDLPRELAVEAREQFVDNFRLGGFVDKGLQPWAEVKRRDPSSKWYGFEYKGEKRGEKGKGKKLNYSPTATQRKILTSKRNYLMNSLRAEAGDGRATVATDAPHAELHQEGGTFKVFGKAAAEMPARPFVGESDELNAKAERTILDALDKIFTK